MKNRLNMLIFQYYLLGEFVVHISFNNDFMHYIHAIERCGTLEEGGMH